MPVQNSNRNTTWNITADNMTWTLAADARITVNGNHGIYEMGHDGSDIRVLGDITVKTMAYGVYLSGSNSSVLVGEDSHIDATKAVDGIYSGAAGASIVNRGLIEADQAGIDGAIWSDIENYGKIVGGQFGIKQDGAGSQIYNYGTIGAKDYGVYSQASGTHVENGKGAEIVSDYKAISVVGGGFAEIVNRGTLRGDMAAIDSDSSQLTVTNTGKIVGDVILGAGEDVFDSRKGSVNGSVEGGDAHDTYYVGASRVKIVEAAGAGTGFDDVYATASHRLAANVEALHLLGGKDIDGTGNGGANYLYGNKGDNALRGGGGDDVLGGAGGDDVLTGNGGQDHFVYKTGGADRITDFEDGTDLLVIDGVASQAQFDALDIKQVKGGDLVIDLGGGDSITVEDMLKSNFDFNDIGMA